MKNFFFLEWNAFKNRSWQISGHFAMFLAFALLFVLPVFTLKAQPGQTITITYTSNGTFTVPAGVTQITVEAWGGGGGGGTRSNNGRGGGGGGGAYARSILNVTPGYTYSLNVGTGGGPSAPGEASTFGGEVVAAGGSGAPSNSDNGAAGGTVGASTGQIRYQGGNGANSDGGFLGFGAYTGGGGGAAGPDGNGGNSGGSDGGTGNGDFSGNGANGHNSQNTNGNPGFAYGGGGSGARRSNGTRLGGYGADGLIRISFQAPVFYYVSGVPMVASNWNTQPNGSGQPAADFTSDYQQFVVPSGRSFTTTDDWTISGEQTALIIESGAEVTAEHSITLSAQTRFEVKDGGIYNHNINDANIWNAGQVVLENQSVVNYGLDDNQAVSPQSYGNLHISGSGTKTLSGDILVLGDLIVSGTAILATSHFSITGNTIGQFVLNDGTSLRIGSTVNAANVTFPSHFLTSNIILHNNSTVVYQAAGEQTISSAPASYGRLTISSGNAKNLQGNIRVNTRLYLNGALLALGNSNLTLAAGATMAGTFSPANMILCNGNGMLIREGTQASHFRHIYPVGTPGVYSPVQITAINAVVHGVGHVAVRAVPGIAPNANPTDMQRHWITQTHNISLTSAALSFTFEASDLPGSKYKPAFWNGSSWQDLPATTMGTTSFSTSGASSLDGIWTAREEITTYYSYQSGNWNSAQTWTTDPSGTLHENPGIPGPNDRVVILNGRSVTLSESNRSVTSLQLNQGGVLDAGLTAGHNFGDVWGQGMLRLRTQNFPGGDFSSFVAAQGGTVEYYDPTANFTLQRQEYNHLILNFSTADRVATLTSALTINGDFTVRSGVFQINDNTNNARTIQIEGSVVVDANGRIQLGTGNANHRFVVKGDFTNNGVVHLTRRTSADYTGTPNYGRADLVFNNGTSDQDLLLNGQSIFHRIEIDKGTDKTYVLNIDATDPSFFQLFGPNNQAQAGTAPNFSNPKALGLLAGTVRLGNNVVLPSLSANDLYIIDEDAMLWLDGAQVTYSNLTSPPNTTALILYGDLRVSGSTVFTDNSGQGIVMRTSASLIIEDGEVNTVQVRPSYQGHTHRGAFHMSGGVLTIRGDLPGGFTAPGLAIYAPFMFPYPDNSFYMSDGVINILSSNPQTSGGNSQGHEFSFIIGANPGNIEVTGGTFNITIPNNRNARLNSTAPVWNINFTSNSTSTTIAAFPAAYAGYGDGSSSLPAIPVQPLIVLNNLTLQNRARLTSGAGNSNIMIGGNFTIGPNATYTPGSNTTIFNGENSQELVNQGTITNGFNHLELAHKSNLGIANDLMVRGRLTTAEATTLRDNGRVIQVQGNIQHHGMHYKPATGAGSIRLTGNAAQTIEGDGAFNNLFINKNGGSVAVESDIQIDGELRMVSAHRLFLGSNMLKLGPEAHIFSSLSGQEQTFNFTRMIVTNGLASDGGIRKEFSSVQPFLFPYGFRAANNNFYYLPSVITFGETPAEWGSLRSRPVNDRHHLAQGTSNSLRVYWKNQAYDFEGIPAGTLVQRFYYDNYFAEGNQNLYVPAVYRSGTTWQVLNDVNLVNQATNEVTFISQTNPTGEYTAGQLSAFENIPILYSRQDGLWNDPATWSPTAVGGAAGSVVPGANTIVVIGNETHQHTILMEQNNQTCGALLIAAGSTLDLQSTNGHTFAALPEEVVTGAGTLRISRTNYFPAGDFGDFIGPNGGTVVYYATNADLNIPLSSASGLLLNQYRNLVLDHGTRIITLPNQNLTIHGDLVFEGGGSNYIGTHTGNGWNSIVVKGKLEARSGTFIIMDGTPSKTLTLQGDLEVFPAATFRVRTSAANTNHTIEFYGNVMNNGVFNMHQTNSRVQAVFKGLDNTVINGSGATYNFYNIIVDKGHDHVPVVSLESEITTGITNPFLTLLNGTFRVNNEQLQVTITNQTTGFSIPPTAALSVLAGDVYVAYGNTNVNNGLELAGRLEVLGGRMYIGHPARTSNNSIEYTAAGQPRIVVSGGELHVNGQIRRSTSTTSGSLNYVQSGGVVNIYGKSRAQSRGLLEIVNPGSLFSMSGGEIVFDRPSHPGTASADLLLRPESHQVTGGILQLGMPGSTAGFQYSLNASCPVWNLHIGTTNRMQILTNDVFDLAVHNNLHIVGNSQFRANGYDVIIRGNLINENSDATAGINSGGYRPGSTGQITTFTGSANGGITGSAGNLTNFANMVVEKNSNRSVILQNNTNIRVQGYLHLKSGRLNDGGNDIALLGNLTNTSTHLSPQSSGGIRLAGSQVQTLSGMNGQLGNLLLDNSNGARLADNASINGRLSFLRGSLYIDDYLLTLGAQASIGGTPDVNRMILLNGVLSDLGVKKIFSAGATPAFVIPIGVSGKYTPVSYQVSNPTQGSITIKPVNRRHPSVADETINELSYYWSVSSENMDNAIVTHRYTYTPADVWPAGDSDTEYVVGYFNSWLNQWSNLGDMHTPGWVNEDDKILVITGQGYLDGDITAGFPINFPEDPLPVFYSRNEMPVANWSNPSAWSTQGHGGSAAATAPHGNAVIIAAGHTRTIDQNNQYASMVTIHGVLDVGQTVSHNLGKMVGTGRIRLESSAQGSFVFPGGNYDEFFMAPTTIVEFAGSNTATLPLKPGNYYKPFQHVVFSGTGQKNTSAEDMRILGSLTLENDTRLNNASYNRAIYVEGDWVNMNSQPGRFSPGTGTVHFAGQEKQHIKVQVLETFYNVIMNHSGEGVSLENSQAGIQIQRRLTLTNGILFSFTGKEVSLFHTTASIAVAGGSNQSFVAGPLRKRIIRGQSFNFPVGNLYQDEGRLGRIELQNTNSTASPDWWTVQYRSTDPLQDYPGNLQDPLTDISTNEYWQVSAPAGGTANMRLRWDQHSFYNITSDPNLRPNLRIVEYNASPAPLWKENGNVVAGNASAGWISGSSALGNSILSIGVIGVTASFDQLDDIIACDNETIVSVPVTLTGTPPWSLTYQTSGNGSVTHFVQHNIMSSPYLINLSGSDMGGFPNSPYTLRLNTVHDAHQPGVVNTGTVSISLLLTHKPDIVGAISVGVNETRMYSTPGNTGSTYQWSWVGASGGNIAQPQSNQTNIVFNQGTGTYTLLLTETSASGCTATDEISVVVSNIPVPSVSPVTPNICITSVASTYTTNYNDGNEYFWIVEGGDCTGCGIWSIHNTVSVVWNQAGAGSVKVLERIGANGPIGEHEQSVLVSTIPNERVVTTDYNQICQGGSTLINVPASEVGISYQLRQGTTPVGPPMAGNNGMLSFPTGNLSGTTTFNVLAYNLGCQRELNDKPIVSTIAASVTLTSSAQSVNNIICPNTEVTLSAVSQNSLAVIWADFSVNSTVVQSAASNTYVTTVLQDNNVVSLQATVQGNCVVNAPQPLTFHVGQGYWTGRNSNLWSVPDNWACGVVPVATTDAVIHHAAHNKQASISPGQVFNARNIVVHPENTLRIENATLNVYGNFSLDGSLIGTGNTLNFTGSANQVIEGTGDILMQNLSLNKTDGVLTLQSPVRVNGTLGMHQGVLQSQTSAMLTLGNNATVQGDNTASFVSGPMRKEGNTDFVFPTGKSGRRGRIGVSGISASKSEIIFQAEYFTGHANHVDVYNLDEGLLLISQQEYWELSNPTSNENLSAHVTLYWDDAGFSGISNPEAVRVVQFRDGQWKNHGPVLGDNPHDDFVTTSTPFNTWGQITFGSKSGDNPFPIELLYFTASAASQSVDLRWATASEINNDFFTLERSSCGRVFEPIGFVSSKAPNGYSTQTLLYQWQDDQPLSGVSYYRLKQTDFDGTFDYSPIVAVRITEQRQNALRLYPNPSRGDAFNVLLQTEHSYQRVGIVVTDTYGKQVWSGQEYTDENGVLLTKVQPGAVLQPGVYVVSLSAEGFRLSQRMVVR